MLSLFKVKGADNPRRRSINVPKYIRFLVRLREALIRTRMRAWTLAVFEMRVLRLLAEIVR